MDEDPVGAAFEEWTRGRDSVAGRIALFERVRDITYQYPASSIPAEVLRRGGASCSGKHYLLGDLFRRQGLAVRHLLCTHSFNDSPLPFPQEMQDMLRKNEIIDLHDYLQVCIDGEWIDVDATWQLSLRDFGFPVTEDWDGKSSMLLTVNADEYEQLEGDLAKGKEEMLTKLTPRQRTLRKQFLESLSKWVEELVAEISREA